MCGAPAPDAAVPLVHDSACHPVMAAAKRSMTGVNALFAPASTSGAPRYGWMPSIRRPGIVSKCGRWPNTTLTCAALFSGACAAAARAAARANCSHGFLTLAPRCDRCGLDYSFADSADGPAFFVMFDLRLHRRCLGADRRGCLSAAVLGPCRVVAAVDPDHDIAAAAPAKGAHDRVAISPQGR